MIRVPPEIDQLMWAVAENPASDAMDEFAARHPEFRAELLKRVEMVRGLRLEVNGKVPRQLVIPKFKPRAPKPAPSPVGTFIALAFGATALAFAGYTAFASLRQPTTPLPAPSLVKTEEVKSPEVIYKPVPKPDPVVKPEPVAPVESTVPPAPEVSSSEKPKDLNLKGVSLLDALELIAAGTNLKLEIGPGFVNQKISVSFHNRTSVQMLRQLAKEYAFTVSDEGDDHYLVLPVPDSNPVQGETPAEDTRRVGP